MYSLPVVLPAPPSLPPPASRHLVEARHYSSKSTPISLWAAWSLCCRHHPRYAGALDAVAATLGLGLFAKAEYDGVLTGKLIIAE